MNKIQMLMRRRKWERYAEKGKLHTMDDADILAYPLVLRDPEGEPYDEGDIGGMPEAQLLMLKREQLRRLAIPSMKRTPRIAPEKRSYTVYLLTDGLAVRIGSTSGSMQTHLKEIQRGNPRKLTVLANQGTLTWTQAKKVKGLLRANQAHKRVGAGWYDMTRGEIAAASLLLETDNQEDSP